MVYINTTGKHNEVWLDKPYATITVECPDCPSTEDAYNSGWTDGSEDGYHKGYQSGRTDGYDDGWDPGYQSGYTDGLEACSGSSCNLSYQTTVLDQIPMVYNPDGHRYEISGSTPWTKKYTVFPLSGYDGMGFLDIVGSIDGYYAYVDGFDKGQIAGAEGEKAKLTYSAFTRNGFYRKYDGGWSGISIQVPQSGHTDQEMQDSWDSGYTSGYTAGQESCSGSSCNLQASKTAYLSGFEWSYDPGDGWRAPRYMISGSPVHISADTGYDGLEEIQLTGYFHPTEAYDDGYGKGYTSGYTDGLNACTGYTQEDLDAAFASGYSAGLRDCSGYTPATSITLNVDSAITDFATATTSFNPSTANTDIYYTSSDPSVATVNPDTGVITVVSEGTVTICAIDRLSELQDCKTISTSKNVLKTFGMAIYEVTSTTSPTTILGVSGSNSFDYMIYDGVRTDINSGTTGYTFSKTGRQVVYYHFIDATTLNRHAFHKATMPIPLPLVALTLPESVTTIGSSAFRETSLEYFVVPKNITSLSGEQTFYMCKSLSSFTFESGSVLEAFYPSLYGSAIRNITIPDNIKEIGDMDMNRSLTAVTIGTGLTSIETNTFENCTALQTVTIAAATPPTVKHYPGLGPLFDNCTSLQHIYVPASSVNAYKTATGWSDHASIISAIQ